LIPAYSYFSTLTRLFLLSGVLLVQVYRKRQAFGVI